MTWIIDSHTSIGYSPRMKWRMLILILLMILLNGCRSQENLTTTKDPIPTLTHTETPTSTQILTPTLTPTPLPEIRYSKGERALFNGDWETAENEFLLAYRETDQEEVKISALFGIGRAYFQQGEFSKAIEIFKSVLNILESPQHHREIYIYLARAYSEMGDFNEAEKYYSKYLEINPGIIDAYIHEELGDLHIEQDNYKKASKAYQSALASDGVRDEIWLGMKLAWATGLSGDIDSAVAMYDSLYTRTNDSNRKALIDLRKGQMLTSVGDLDGAFEAYQDAVNNFPKSYEAYSALLALVEAGVQVDEFQRGLVDYYAGQYAVAISAFYRYLNYLPEDPASAHYYSGMAYQKLGSYSEAISEFDFVIDYFPDHPIRVDAWFEKAKTQDRYLQNPSMGIQTLLVFANTYPDDPKSIEFLFEAGEIAESALFFNQAVSYWELLTIRYPHSSLVHQANYKSGLTEYRLGSYSSALRFFGKSLNTSTTASERAAALLWMGKCYQTLGDENKADESWELAGVADPFGYYSVRSLDLLNERGPFSSHLNIDLSIDFEREKSIAEEWIRFNFGIAEGIDLDGIEQIESDPHFIRGNEYWKIGLYSEARNEFEDLRKSLSEDPVGTYQLMNHLLDLGLYRSVIFSSRQILNMVDMSDVETLSTPFYFNILRFGTYYQDLILGTAEEYEFHPLLIFSLIRQESLFEAFIKSSASATGLMQIMPATGSEIASNLEWPENYTTSDLNRPHVSIRFGIDYLDSMRNIFEGDMYAVLSAYNGGPGNTLKWIKRAPDDPDLFLELISFSETQLYIRRIYENFNIYRYLYEKNQEMGMISNT